MKKKLLLTSCCALITLMAAAQASGGQIIRPNKKYSNNSSTRMTPPTHNSKTSKTYTVKEQYEIGSSFYEKGNYQEAIKWYTKAAENGYPDAQSELGFMYLNGEGVVVNRTEAVKWLSKAGEKGDAMAQQALGYMYKNGDGVIKSDLEAQKWYSKAAPQFYELSRKMMKSGNQQCVNFFGTVIDMDISPYNVWSLFHLGAIYYYGDGGHATDFSQSFRYFKLAADKGNKPAMYYLGLCYEYGRGIPKDLSRAQQYYKESGYTSVPSRDF